jgi:hypothetical protein
MVSIKFYSAGGPSSGVELSGTFGQRIVSGYGSTTFGQPIILGEAQDITWITSSAGVPLGGTPIAQSGQMNNTKWMDASGVSVNSGVRTTLPITQSGHATIRIEVTETGNINISGAKLYAYNGTDIAFGPTGVWVLSAEIIPPSMSGNGDTQWALIDNVNYNYFVDRTPGVGYPAAASFNYFVALSVRPKLTASSGLQTFGLAIRFDYS